VRSLPDTGAALVLRTDFSADSAWDSVVVACTEPSPEGFQAGLSFVDDPLFAGVDADDVAAMPGAAARGFVFLVDAVTLTHPEMPLVAVDLHDEPGRSFRVIPGQMWSIENNLSLSNMFFAEFADSVDADGVFRGFPTPAPLSADQEAAVRAIEERDLFGDRVPNERLRAVDSPRAKRLARLDIDLTFALAEADDAVHRAVAVWAALRAMERAGIAELAEIAPAVAALRRGAQPSPPFDDLGHVWPIVQRAPYEQTVVPAPLEGHHPLCQQDSAMIALFASTRPDSLTAALEALLALADVHGRDGYRPTIAAVWDTFPDLARR
jgi:hypothetical protein